MFMNKKFFFVGMFVLSSNIKAPLIKSVNKSKPIIAPKPTHLSDSNSNLVMYGPESKPTGWKPKVAPRPDKEKKITNKDCLMLKKN